MYTLIIGGILIGVSLGLLGSGGAILTIPILMFGLGLSEKLAIINSLAIVAIISGVSSAKNIAADTVQWRIVARFGIPSIGGTYIGSVLGQSVSGSTQIAVFVVIVFISAIKMWLSSNGADAITQSKNVDTAKLVLSGVFVGVLTGFVGVGGGFLIVPALILLAGVPLINAVATSLLIITFNSLTGFYKYFTIGNYSIESFDWRPILILAGVGILGSLIGLKWSKKFPAKTMKKSFSIILMLVGLYTTWQLLF